MQEFLTLTLQELPQAEMTRVIMSPELAEKSIIKLMHVRERLILFHFLNTNTILIQRSGGEEN